MFATPLNHRYCTLKNTLLIGTGLIITLLAYMNEFSVHRTYRIVYNLRKNNFTLFDDDWLEKIAGVEEGEAEPDTVDNTTTKYIFDWTTFFGTPFGPVWLAQCPDFNCKFTRDKQMYGKADAVVFHMRDFDFNDLPRNRRPDQYFVFYLLESPHHTYVNLLALESYFNVTISYRYDSDFYLPYGNIRPRLHPANPNFTYELESLAQGKKKLIAWMVGNCNSPSQRHEYVNELQKYVPVDIYGKCGSMSCKDCDKMLDENYKFYLSFENSLCKDYTTEKLFARMKNYVVPIVLSRKYSSNAGLPPHSVIAADEFCSVKDLADYLQYLDKNHTAYLQYFRWRTKYESGDPFGCSPDMVNTCGFCGLCRSLHQPNRTQKILRTAHDWWIKRAECKTELVPDLLARRGGGVSRLMGGLRICYSNTFLPTAR